MGMSWTLPCWGICSQWAMDNIPEVSSGGLGSKYIRAPWGGVGVGTPFLRWTPELT